MVELRIEVLVAEGVLDQAFDLLVKVLVVEGALDEALAVLS